MKFKWEEILSKDSHLNRTSTSRAKVFGGWVVGNRSLVANQFAESMVFVPDPNHEWKIENEI